MMRFDGRAVLITGAGSGVGAAFARRAAQEGAGYLALIDRDAAALSRTADDLAAGGAPIRSLALDITEETAWAEALNVIRDDIGGVDAAALCAGVASATPITDMSLAEWRGVMAVNLDGAFLSLQASLRLAGGRPGAAVVVVGSATGLKPAPGTAAYGASKAGVAHLTKVAALEAAPQIRVNALCPAGVKTPMFSNAPFFHAMAAELGGEEAAWAALAADMPLGRFAEAEEVAAQIAFLLSDDAATITGATLLSDGGYAL